MSEPIQVVWDLEKQIDELQQRRLALIQEVQSACPHPPEALREADYVPGIYYAHATPPFRVCTKCGYAEEGWGCGYWRLATREEVPYMTRDHLREKYVKRLLTQSQLSEIRYRKRPEKAQ